MGDDNNAQRRRSMYATVEKIRESSVKRRSFFDTSFEASNGKDSTCPQIEEWNRRWGVYNTDYVNVKYPEGYKQKVKEEIDLWIKGLEGIIERAEAFASQIEYTQILEGCELTAEQKMSLEDIDCKINMFIEEASSFLKSLEVSKNLQELKLKAISRDVKIVEKLIVMESDK